jgi:hypothetical protein
MWTWQKNLWKVRDLDGIFGTTENTLRKQPNRKPTREWAGNIKIDLEQIKLALCEKESMSGFCENGNEFSCL